tara:strand:+ start:677 stop:868 length:192 start_codon:yes stop_codon:yes gene_type:complete
MNGSRNYTAKYPFWKKLRNHTIIGTSLIAVSTISIPVATVVAPVWWLATFFGALDLINGNDAS